MTPKTIEKLNFWLNCIGTHDEISLFGYAIFVAMFCDVHVRTHGNTFLSHWFLST
jgi:hypothetical protein